MSKTSFRAAAVIGTGMMGPGIAATLALGGVRATILSRTEENAAKGVDLALAQLRALDDATLKDIGLHRSGIEAAVDNNVRQARPTRAAGFPRKAAFVRATD